MMKAEGQCDTGESGTVMGLGMIRALSRQRKRSILITTNSIGNSPCLRVMLIISVSQVITVSILEKSM